MKFLFQCDKTEILFTLCSLYGASSNYLCPENRDRRIRKTKPVNLRTRLEASLVAFHLHPPVFDLKAKHVSGSKRSSREVCAQGWLRGHSQGRPTVLEAIAAAQIACDTHRERGCRAVQATQGSTSAEQEVEEALERGERVGTNSRFQQKETGEAGLILTSVSYFRSLQWAVGTRAALVVWPLALGAQGGRTVAWSVRAPQGVWPGL